MNGSKDLVKSLAGGLKAQLSSLDNGVEVVIIPPSLYIADVLQALVDTGLDLGVQDVAQWQQGAYTGEISAAMASDVGCGYALVGHSERRQLFGESDDVIAAKVRQVLSVDLTAIVCVGETLEDRDAGRAESVVSQQMRKALQFVTAEQWKNIVVAYEPVWAIGTGKTATAEDAQQMHQQMRGVLDSLGAPATEITLLYGGSVKPDNAAGLFAQPDIDGGLIGGASLVADEFVQICRSV